MYNGINSQKLLESMRPLGTKLENSMASSLYFVLYMIVTTFILLQLFVGFVIVTFQEVGVTSYKETRMNRNQVFTVSIYIAIELGFFFLPCRKRPRVGMAL